jgi:multiple sugar transport system permease protein
MKPKRKWVGYAKSSGKFLVLLFFSMIIWLPIIVVVFTSFKYRSEIFTLNPSIFPKTLNFDNYTRLLKLTDFGLYLKNSLLVAGFTSGISLLVSSLAAYALVWMEFKGKQGFIGLILIGYIFPQILLVIPLFLMCFNLHLLDTKLALVLTYLSFILPFAVWTLRNYFLSISSDLVDAGLIDGCNYFQCLVRVVLPVCLPVMATVLTYSFVLAWDEYMFANILIQSDVNRTVAIGVQAIVGSHATDYGLLTAASVLMILPVIIFFILVQRLFIDNLMMGSVKE